MVNVLHAKSLLSELRGLIEQARQHVAQTANSTLTLLYWRVGARLQREVLNDGRAEYGRKILATLSQQLSWSHFVEILPLKASLEREYYAELCRIERWSVRTLRERIDGQLYLRTAISKKPEVVVKAEISHLRGGGQMTPDLVFRDPYMLDFLGLQGDHSEHDL
jgi:hypothetical protein